MEKILRLDKSIMDILIERKAFNKTHSMTINEINYYRGEQLSARPNLAKRIRGLTSNGLIAKGIMAKLSDTYFITEKGKAFINGEYDEADANICGKQFLIIVKCHDDINIPIHVSADTNSEAMQIGMEWCDENGYEIDSIKSLLIDDEIGIIHI